MTSRRAALLALLASGRCLPALAAGAAAASASLAFPRDFGSHPEARIEWWYLTGALDAGLRTWGFQITFFRAATGLTGGEGSSFKAGQLLFAHAAVTDLERGRLRHDQRMARAGFGIAEAKTTDTGVVLRDWQLDRQRGSDGVTRYRAAAASESAGFQFALSLQATQPVLVQGENGVSQKAPVATHTSRYYSEPQLAARGALVLDGGAPIEVVGDAWLDHEWSDALLAPEAVGWDWIGMNLENGAALTAFRLRRADGSTFWAGGSHRRTAESSVRNFAASEVSFAPGRLWTSPASKARYPVVWNVATPVGRFTVEAMQDDQELDSRASTGSTYWEGLSRLRDPAGRVVGRGYLEMTGYAGRLKL